MGRDHLCEKLLGSSINHQLQTVKPYSCIRKAILWPLIFEHREGDLPASCGDFTSAINRCHKYYFAVGFAIVQHGQIIGFASKAHCSVKVRTTRKSEILHLIQNNINNIFKM